MVKKQRTAPLAGASSKGFILAVVAAAAVAAMALGVRGVWGGGLFVNRHDGAPTTSLRAEPQQGIPPLLQSAQAPPLGLLQAEGGPAKPPALLRSEPQPPGPILSSQAPAAPPVTAFEAPQADMPEEVRAWLEHLRATEERRGQLATEQVSQSLSSLLGMVGGDFGAIGGALSGEGALSLPRNPDGPAQVAQGAGRMAREWAQLAQFFNAKAPPAECRPLAQTYNQVLDETGSMIQEIVGIVSGAGGNPLGAVARLQSMLGKSGSRIDAAAERADRSVAAICGRYKTPKWFSIAKDFGEGALSNIGL